MTAKRNCVYSEVYAETTIDVLAGSDSGFTVEVYADGVVKPMRLPAELALMATPQQRPSIPNAYPSIPVAVDAARTLIRDLLFS
jgi:hypothetical protein